MKSLNPHELIRLYYDETTPLYEILVTHSEAVTRKAVELAERHPELGIDIQFVQEAAMIHDIGIFKVYAPSIHCHGTHHYIEHGYLGAELVREAGFPKHARICERHTGTGLTIEEIADKQLPLPLRDMRPISIEEQLICFADKFFSKSHIHEELSMEKIRNTMSRFGEHQLKQFDEWCRLFL